MNSEHADFVADARERVQHERRIERDLVMRLLEVIDELIADDECGETECYHRRSAHVPHPHHPRFAACSIEGCDCLSFVET